MPWQDPHENCDTWCIKCVDYAREPREPHNCTGSADCDADMKRQHHCKCPGEHGSER